ncbi:M56 family metallopeptidase [Runella slithyformis]|uniref:Peptidase M56 BlaR1 n=1 Tax=Runella slithyformis (strain ATCC 29530 / DSM 19594 / LMG 11500 / NCIMB 11436 / LSU 4) TaxID=761193 RepID=A0A7U3ZMI5_RUNSL|nr:M56 family metallopeptidase [Runella slithyformis]AEI49960.1 peptidase M56 BlaR1 [Runella slithyformis DSM 19594]
MNYEFFSYLLKAGFVLAILTSAYAWLVKRETFLQVNRWLLWINVAATLLLPVIPLPDVAWMPDAPAKAVAVVLPPAQLPPATMKDRSEPYVSTPQQAVAADSELTGTNPESSLSVWDWIGIIYGAVAGLLTLKLMIQLGALWRLKRNGTQYTTDEGVYLIESDGITSPFSFFNRIFYNPAHHNEEEWAQVWAHECVHAHQLHSLDMLTAEVLKIVFWFNPFAWWHQRLVRETLEFITDRAVLNSGIEKKSYQYHLLRTTLSADKQTFTSHFGGPNFNKSFLKARIEMMNKANSKWMGIGKYFAFVGMLWLCAAFTKPYREEVTKKVASQVPALKAILESVPAPKAAFNDFVWDEPLTEIRKDSLSLELNVPLTVEADTQTLVSSTKYITYEKGVLHWLITPKTTLEDFVEMKKEFAKRDLRFEVTEVKMDPLNTFIIGITAGAFRNEGSGATIRTYAPEDSIRPIPSRGGYISIGKSGFGGTLFKKDMVASLTATAIQEEEIAQKEWDKNRIKYLQIQTTDHLGAGGSTTFTKESLTNLKSQAKKSRYLNLSANNFLQIAEARRNDIVMLNGKSTTMDEIEQIPLSQFHSAIFMDTWNKDKTERKYYTLIFTEK